MEAPQFQVWNGKTQQTCHCSDFLIGMALLFPSMMEYMYYESNGGSGLHGFCVFLSFRLSVNILLWVHCDYCEMLAFVSDVMGVIDCKVCTMMIGLK